MQKNDQNPPAKNPSYHVKVQLVCGGGPLYIITFSKKNWDTGIGRFPPEPTHNHTPTRRHADTPTRRPRTRGTHTANTTRRDDSQHTHREGGWKVQRDSSAAHHFSFFLRTFGVICTFGNPAAAHSCTHNRRRSVSVLVWINRTLFISMLHTAISRFVIFVFPIDVQLE